MALTRTSMLRLIRFTAIGIVGCMIVAYAIWRSLDYARGPRVTILDPQNGSSISAPSVVIRGHAERVTAINLNQDAISMDVHGDFSETILLFPGLNKLVFTATDQFGRTATTTLDLVGLADFSAGHPVPNSPANPAATSTASTTGL